MPTALSLIAAERDRQKHEEGWTLEHDDQHTIGELARAAACYAIPPSWREVKTGGVGVHVVYSVVYALWPAAWSLNWFKPTPQDRIRELVKAGALIVAEIERLARAEEREDETK